MIRQPLLSYLCVSFLLLQSSVTFADLVSVDDAQLTMNKELNEDIFRTLQYLNLRHYLPNNLDDDYSSRTLDSYLELLDPNKIHFSKGDINDFEKYRFTLDDSLKQLDAEPAFDIFKRFRQRISQRTDLALELIEQDFDFSKDDELLFDREKYTWASTDDQIKQKWSARIKNDVLIQLLSDTPIEEIRQNLRRRYERQRDVTYQLKADEVFEWFMNAYTKELEPHAQYMSDITAENFRINMSLSLEGIGASLQTEDDYTVINRIIPGGPAERSKALHAEDKIVGVGQDGEEMINVIGWRLMDVVKMIRGKKDTKVHLQVQKHDDAPGSPPENIELVRDVIQLEDQAAKLTSVNVPDGEQTKTFSVISIPSFYSNAGNIKNGEKHTATTHDVKKLLSQIDKSHSQGLIIDLRNNGGGYLNEAISLTGLFIPQGPVVQVIKSNRKRDIYGDTDKSVAYDGPLVVLVNRYSASASEIFAAALQDYGRAIIVGERSFGKGSVQAVTPLRYGNNNDHESQIKFTTSLFFRINGGSTQHRGVTPDIRINAGVEDDDFGERAYENALPWSQTEAANYTFSSYPAQLFKDLTAYHLQRSEQSPAFNFLRQNSALITKNKEIKSLPLNMKKRKQLREQQEALSLSRLNDYRKTLGLDPVTQETKKDNPLPDEDEHWNIVYHKEAAKILLDQINWSDDKTSAVAQHEPD